MNNDPAGISVAMLPDIVPLDCHCYNLPGRGLLELLRRQKQYETRFRTAIFPPRPESYHGRPRSLGAGYFR